MSGRSAKVVLKTKFGSTQGGCNLFQFPIIYQQIISTRKTVHFDVLTTYHTYLIAERKFTADKSEKKTLSFNIQVLEPAVDDYIEVLDYTTDRVETKEHFLTQGFGYLPWQLMNNLFWLEAG